MYMINLYILFASSSLLFQIFIMAYVNDQIMYDSDSDSDNLPELEVYEMEVG